MDDILKARLEFSEMFEEAVHLNYLTIIHLITSHFEGKRTKEQVFDAIWSIVREEPVKRN